ncbi:MAG: Fmu (Sun) domain-containing protein [Ferruginibacter sp.]
MRYHSYLNSAKKIIESNRGDVPFSLFLKKYFAANKKYGSKDRKQIATLCYNFYRLGKALPDISIEEKIITGTFLCEQVGNDFLAFHKPEWNDLIAKPLDEKIAFIDFDIKKVFPWINELSDGIDLHSFSSSFFYQPDLFLRIRPGKKDVVIKKLEDAGLAFNMPDEDCIALHNATKLDTIIELDKEAVVQDSNSQKVLDVLKKKNLAGINETLTVWDCCAASGGKSILACDILNGELELTVSDIRQNILSNLEKRFLLAGMKKYKSLIADLSNALEKPISNSQFQIIICDAPCTGSGTWSRTPEQLYFFKEEMIADYAEKQKRIVTNVIPQLQKGGMFIYITCSVFKKENEEIVNFIKEQFHLHQLQMELLKGYDKKADSMFVAVFKS